MITKKVSAGSYKERIKITPITSEKVGLEIVETAQTPSIIKANVKLISKHRQDFFQKTYDALGYQFLVRDDVAINDNDKLEWGGMEFKIHTIAPDLETKQLVIEAYSTDTYTNQAIT